MKLESVALAALLPLVQTRFVETSETDRVILYPEPAQVPMYTLEVAPGETLLASEEDKWALRREGRNFLDITDHADLGKLRASANTLDVTFPKKCRHQKQVHHMIKELKKENMRENLEKFTSFHTRYFRSEHGRKSSEWLLSRIQGIIDEAGANETVSAAPFRHDWPQSSIIVTIPGRSNDTVVGGAHQDSINLFLPSLLPAPGADDDGSGTVTTLEVLRTLLTNKDVVRGAADNTIEFHWYSAEEGGLLGSQAIFSAYEKEGRAVKAMLQQDMTGHIQRGLDAGRPESVGVIVDYVDKGLTEFIKKVITEYCTIPYVETKCGYACSDHASASKAGYPSAFVIESAFDVSNEHVHSTEDTIDRLSFDHMLEHARMTLGLAYELGHADLSGESSDEL